MLFRQRVVATLNLVFSTRPSLAELVTGGREEKKEDKNLERYAQASRVAWVVAWGVAEVTKGDSLGW